MPVAGGDIGKVYKMHEEHLGVMIWLLSLTKNFVSLFFGHSACGILVSQPGIKPVPLQWKPRVLTTHWTNSKVHETMFLKTVESQDHNIK